VVEELQGDGGAAHLVTLRSVVGDVLSPPTPHIDGLLQPFVRPGKGMLVGYPSPAQKKGHTIALPKRMDAFETIQPKRGCDSNVELGECPASEAETAGGRFGIGATSGKDLDPQANLSLQHLHPPKHFPPSGGGILSQVGSGPKGHGVRDSNGAGVGPHLRDQNAGVLHVPLSGLKEILGREGESPSPIGVEDRTEERWGIEPRDAQP
jgi:hypothetical protein